ncbi:energy-coupling factor ABC transporter ATP-binding protein [Spirochaeta isovalerica]|uniref:Biotin transport system ATP-binding protein n=1 Tax=Spirochaeta isovalerica TaxID=150 RepID=A0A841RH76_9SPIO|nr:ABC transporter ATP-binding protein [Spirochaeta isovalerica]MBB6482547.1 biotin transport system ATP-binding protein [Spirochaeta isovalerica]
MTENTPIIEISRLSHIFSDGTMGLSDITFSVNRGEFLIISGPNGSGKSVLMKHLNGLLSPSEGDILIDGVPLSGDLISVRKKIGLVFQDADSQIIGQTVEKDAAFGPENLRLSREEIDRRVHSALDEVKLLHRKKSRPHILSGGEKRRLAVAGILCMEPELFIFDEPFSNLDYSGVKQVLHQLVDLHEKGHTIIVITHDLGKVLAHGTRLIIMEKGRIVAEGQPDGLLDSLEQWGIRRPKGLKSGDMTWLR